MTRKPVLIIETIKIHLAEYNFYILDEKLDKKGCLLHVNTSDADINEKLIGNFFHHPSLDHLKQVRDAVIDAEKNSQFFIAQAGDGLFKDASRKISSLKKAKKEKVFSIRFDLELKTRFAKKCNEIGQSQSEVLRLLMENYLSEEESCRQRDQETIGCVSGNLNLEQTSAYFRHNS